MTQKNFILAHDLGTTGNKSTLFNVDGSIVATTFAGYPTNYPHPNWAEQDPADWQKAIFESTRRLLAKSAVSPEQIAAISFSGHMQGALVVDKAGTPLRSHILWADQRATKQAAFITECCGRAETYQLTGNRVSPAYTAAKLLWIKDNQPNIYNQIHKVLQVKDYGAFLLTGVFATDYSDAALTQMLDLENKCWAVDMLAQLEISPKLLPNLYASAEVIGGVTQIAAAATGLQVGTPVVIGGGDGACATVGAGSITVGDVYNYIGSSSWVALSTKKPILDPQERTFNFFHLDPNLNCAIGTMQAAGGAFDWLDRLLRDEDQTEPRYKMLDDVARQISPGATGLLFLPYLLGERSPHWNPQARAAFVGLAMPHSRGEMARAIMEGVAFNLRHILEILRSQGVAIEAMRLIGGGGKSTVWRQILADVYDLPILQLSLSTEATALGAAIAGGVGVGLYPDYSVTNHLIPVKRAEQPNLATKTRYAALYELFKQTYTVLEPIYQQLATLPD